MAASGMTSRRPPGIAVAAGTSRQTRFILIVAFVAGLAFAGCISGTHDPERTPDEPPAPTAPFLMRDEDCAGAFASLLVPASHVEGDIPDTLRPRTTAGMATLRLVTTSCPRTTNATALLGEAQTLLLTLDVVPVNASWVQDTVPGRYLLGLIVDGPGVIDALEAGGFDPGKGTIQVASLPTGMRQTWRVTTPEGTLDLITRTPEAADGTRGGGWVYDLYHGPDGSARVRASVTWGHGGDTGAAIAHEEGETLLAPYTSGAPTMWTEQPVNTLSRAWDAHPVPP